MMLNEVLASSNYELELERGEANDLRGLSVVQIGHFVHSVVETFDSWLAKEVEKLRRAPNPLGAFMGIPKSVVMETFYDLPQGHGLQAMSVDNRELIYPLEHEEFNTRY